jgi:putative hydrolase of HD superfamily
MHMNSKLHQIIQFLHQAEKLKSTLRHNWTTSGRQESTAEHTWRLMLMFLLLDHEAQFQVDSYHTMKMILVHDIAELVHGDVPGFIKSKDAKQLAQKREHEAAVKLFQLLPSPTAIELFALFKEYEQGKTKEAKVAKAIDKLETMLQHLEAGMNYMIPEEMGDATLKYADKPVEALGNKHISELWKWMKEELRKMMEE